MGVSYPGHPKRKGRSQCTDGAYDAFVYAMNKKPKVLVWIPIGLANPHGLDFEQYSADMHCSARDVAKMCTEAMKNETFPGNNVLTEATTIQVFRNGQQVDVKLESTDVLLGTYDGACGVKTGFTEKAGECFAGAVQRDGKILYSIVLGSSTLKPNVLPMQHHSR